MTPDDLIAQRARDLGIDPDDVSSVDISEPLDALEHAHPALAPILRWARAGIGDRSGDLTRDYAQLVLDARKLVEETEALRCAIRDVLDAEGRTLTDDGVILCDSIRDDLSALVEPDPHDEGGDSEPE